MSKIEMEAGKIYFISFGSNTQLVVRFKEEDETSYKFFDHIHCWNGYETFHNRGAENYCVKHGIEEMRPASLIEKQSLLMFELKHDCI